MLILTYSNFVREALDLTYRFSSINTCTENMCQINNYCLHSDGKIRKEANLELEGLN